MKEKKIKQITTLGILTSLSVILSVVDKIISSVAFAYLPVVKIGLANIIILIGLYTFDVKSSFVLALLKSVLTGLIFSSITSFVIGGVGTLLSYFSMLILKKTLDEKVSAISVSVVGGLMHTLGQLIVVKFIYNLNEEILLYGSWLAFVSIITGFIIGAIVNKLLQYKNSH